MRSATSKTSGMLWLISTTARPRSRTRRMRSSTLRVWTTPSAAVGSSMKTTLLAHVTARLTATPWRWPPDIVATGALESCRPTPRLLNASSARRCISRVVEEAELAEEAAARDLAAEEQVGGGVEVGGEREVLVDGLDAERAGLERRGDRHRPALEEDLAGVGRLDARQALHERALAGAVVADERDDLARVDGEVRAAQRAHAAEPLDDAAGLEQGLGHQAVLPAGAGIGGSASALSNRPAATPASSAAPRQPASTTGGVSSGPRRALAASTASSRAQPPVTTRRRRGPATSSTRAS